MAGQSPETIAPQPPPPAAVRPSATALFVAFLRLGLTAFGGPAMVAYIRELAVVQKGWLDERGFRDGVALCQSLPGATARQTAAYVGLRTAGLWGALLSFVGRLLSTTVQFGMAATRTTLSTVLAALAFLALRLKVDIVWVVLGGGIVSAVAL